MTKATKPRYIFITGGVVSSLGKGLAAAALAALLQARGYSVRIRKLDPYLNVDPGTMSPYQHGEVFVTDDGAETDLDLGHYERFTGVSARSSDSVSSGRIYSTVLAKERKGEYLGATVQVVPHVTDQIKEFIRADVDGTQFIICEIGGTVGDIESLPFLEAIRQFGNEWGRGNVMFIHVTLLPYIAVAGELKTKPTQHSVRELLSVGIQPDLLLCRAERDIPEGEIKKIALFCNVPAERVIPALNVDNIYAVTESYHGEGLDEQVLKYFGLEPIPTINLARWKELTHTIRNPQGEVRVGIVGKYISLLDAYKSLAEALAHGGIANKVKVHLEWIDSEELEKQDVATRLKGLSAILIPGGFGERGTAGKIKAAQYAREHKVPFLGICFGMQLAVIEAARNLCGLTKASTTEFGPCAEPLVGLMTEWTKGNELEKRAANGDLGGTMRLGAYPCQLKAGSKVASVYGTSEISERHRHRYEVNIKYKDQLEKAGVVFSGLSPDGVLPEIIERADHPWFIGVQFHPELKSRPLEPHPLFVSFIKAATASKAA
jgi:CTP synthase